MPSKKPAATILFFLLLCTAADAAQSAKADGASEAAARLRALYFARDFEGGYVDGKKLVQQYPDSTGVKVWWILNAGRNERYDEALEALQGWKPADEGWQKFALAGALYYNNERSKEALPASEAMLALLPGNDDAVWLRAAVIRQNGKVEDALAFIEQNLAKVKNPAELLVVKASALYSQYNSASQGRDESKWKGTLDAFAEALKADPANVNAHYLQASYLMNQKKPAEAHALLKKAIALAPDSTAVHSEYWRAVSAMSDRSDEEKMKEIEADVALLRKSRGSYVGSLIAVSRLYETWKLADKQREVDEYILKLEPISREAEWVLIGRLRRLASEVYQDKEKKDTAKRLAYRKMLQEYVGRPRHFNKMLLGESYRNLFNQLKGDSTVSNSELLAVARGMVQYEKINVHSTYPVAAIALAERKASFRDAEAWAREGIVEAKKKVDSQRQFYKTDAEYEKSLNWMTAMMYDALGWVFFQEGRMAEAEKELLEAHRLSAEDLNNLNHIGEFYQAKKDYARAEEYFIKGALVQTPGENKNAKALKSLYELRNGGLEGYDKYLVKLGEMDAANRKVKVLAERIKEPKLMNAFNLKTLDGKMLSSADLKGKVVVVNYWGIWCGWCVEEMPDFQKLHEKYRNDPEVVILTINNDQNPADVPKWMQKYKYTFNVLFDDGFVNDKASINTFPTTWFIDKDGRISFVKVGWTQKLTEEFSWRIEALRAREGAATN